MRSETVTSGAEQRLVPPGEYRVVGWWGSNVMTVRADDTVAASFYDTCRQNPSKYAKPADLQLQRRTLKR